MTAVESWEYHVEVFSNPEVLRLGDTLNRLGADGWELVSTVTTVKTWVNLTGNDLVFVFKRRGRGPFTERPEDQPGYVPYA
jgi:hypothetical protein